MKKLVARFEAADKDGCARAPPAAEAGSTIRGGLASGPCSAQLAATG